MSGKTKADLEKEIVELQAQLAGLNGSLMGMESMYNQVAIERAQNQEIKDSKVCAYLSKLIEDQETSLQLIVLALMEYIKGDGIEGYLDKVMMKMPSGGVCDCDAHSHCDTLDEREFDATGCAGCPEYDECPDAMPGHGNCEKPDVSCADCPELDGCKLSKWAAEAPVNVMREQEYEVVMLNYENLARAVIALVEVIGMDKQEALEALDSVPLVLYPRVNYATAMGALDELGKAGCLAQMTTLGPV
jgi:hypothetical protein